MTKDPVRNTPAQRLASADTPEQAAERVRQVLPFMARSGLAPHPLHFTIAWEHLSGRNAALSEDINRRTADTGPGALTPEVCEALYTRHILDPDALTLEALRDRMNGLVGNAIDGLTHASTQAQRCQVALDDQCEQLEHLAGDPSALRNILGAVLSEARSLTEVSHGLERRLDETNREIVNLREELSRVRQTALTDALTGLANRAALDRALVERAIQPSGTGLNVLMIDIDHFKSINDRFGHLVGDKVLRYLGGVLKGAVGERGLAARYGGEEFAVLVDRIGDDAALALAESIRRDIEASQLRRKEGGESLGTITVSIGVAAAHPGETSEALLARADSALYEAKHGGRNRVVKAPEQTRPERRAGSL